MAVSEVPKYPVPSNWAAYEKVLEMSMNQSKYELLGPSVKFWVSLSPELHSALTNASLDHYLNMSGEIESLLRQHPTIKEYIEQVRAEPDTGVLVVKPDRTKIKLPMPRTFASE